MTALQEACVPKRVKNIAGKRFSYLTAIRYVGNDHRHFAQWECKCDCGTIKIIRGASLQNGLTTSCLCMRVPAQIEANSTQGGLGRTREYGIWNGMKRRCNDPDDPAYFYYGARGISICTRWHTFSNFLEDMGKCNDGLSLDRIDVNGNYEPTNCRWATRNEQARNTRKALKFDGKPLAQIAEETGVHYGTLYYRLKKHGTPFKGIENA